MDSHDIAQLATWLTESGLSSLTLEGPGTRLTLSRHGSGTAPVAVDSQTLASAAAPSAPEGGLCLRAPCAGIFLSTHPLRSQPLVRSGDLVRPGQTVALLQVGPLLTPVRARTPGRVTAACAEPGHTVGYGSPLFELSPAD